MIYVYVGLQVVALFLWFAVWPHLSGWVVFIPSIAAAVHFGVIIGIIIASLVVMGWMKSTQNRTFHKGD